MKKKPEYPLRTRFANDIVCEFLPPQRKSNKVLILATGMPGYPGGRGTVIAALAAKGYWVFVPRYRGSWESDGKFLAKSPHEDLLDVISGLSKGFIDLSAGKKYKIVRPEVYLIGGSFGGPAAILASRDPQVKKAVAISAVVDWRKQGKTKEPVELMEQLLPRAWGQAYRGDVGIWKKIGSGKFYNPVHESASIVGEKLLIFHTQDDDLVPFAPARDFAKEVGARFVSFKTGGHGGTYLAAHAKYWRRIEAFFKGK